MLDMDWEQGLYRAGRGLLRRLQRTKGGPARTRESAVRLEDHVAALQTLARAIAGRPLRIVGTSGMGGVGGLDLLLPDVIDRAADAPGNRELYVVRVAVSAAIVRLDLAGRADPARAAQAACDWLGDELGGFAAALARARHIAPDELIFGARFEAEPGSAQVEVGAAGEPGVDADCEAPESEAAAPRVGALERIELERDERGDIVWNPFERVETLDEYRGGSRNLDGGDDLDAHLEALAEVDLGKLTRGGGPARGLLRADVALDADTPDATADVPAADGIAYDEWDRRSQSYRPGWCTVYARRAERRDPGWAADARVRHRRRVEELRRRLERHRYGMRRSDHQLDGEDFDLAALVDEHAALRAGRGGDPRLFVRQEHRRRDFATTVLLDVSLSTDAWVRGRRVLDVARDAVFVLGEVAAQLGDRLRVLAFASETRNRCHVWELLGWDEPWSLGCEKLGALVPVGYTRIGPAIRHATADLARVAAERRLLLLVSDAKPSDHDRYEGRYGIADVRQALREAQQNGLRTHALAVDARASERLPELAGAGGWHALPRPELLAEVLTEVYGRLSAVR